MRNRRLSVAILAGILVLAAVGCDPASETSDGATGEPTEGGTLRIGTNSSIPSFNPFYLLTAQQGVAFSMTYPQLAQFAYDEESGYSAAPDFAESWEISEDHSTITFKTRPNATWSDGQPLTAEDAAWTINTAIEYQDGPTGQMVPALEGIKDAEAINDTTLVVNYDQPVPDGPFVMAAGLMPILPKHVWEPLAQGDGKELRTFRPELEPEGVVSGGPFLLEQHEKNGTTVYVRNPDYYGEPSNAEAVAVTYYTNENAMLEDLRAGELDWVDTVPPSAVTALEEDGNLEIHADPLGAQLDLWFNSNPRKPQHRELLDPQVKEALAMCIDREQIIEVNFSGYGEPVETMVGGLGGEFENTSLEPRPFDCAAASDQLDALGYEPGPDGIRVVPATTGELAEPEHRMSYEILTEANAPWNMDRAVEILRSAWADIGIEVTQKVGGDETATWEYKTGEDCDPQASTGYEEFDMELNLSIPELDPLSTLSGELKESWCVWNFTGYDNPKYDKLYGETASTLDQERRKELMWQMQQIYFDDLASVSLVEEESVSATSNAWTGFVPNQLQAYSKEYYTAPHLTG